MCRAFGWDVAIGGRDDGELRWISLGEREPGSRGGAAEAHTGGGGLRRGGRWAGRSRPDGEEDVAMAAAAARIGGCGKIDYDGRVLGRAGAERGLDTLSLLVRTCCHVTSRRSGAGTYTGWSIGSHMVGRVGETGSFNGKDDYI